MRSATLKYAAILGLLASGTVLSGCSDDARGNGAVLPTLSVTSTEPSLSSDLPVTTFTPVDHVAAKAAWKAGVDLFDNGDYQAASDRLKTAVAGEPQNAYRHYLLGLALLKSGDREGAESSLIESTKLDSTKVKSWINLSRVRHELGNRTGALEAAEQGLAIDPISAEALHQKGRALMELNRGAEALVVLTTAHELASDNGYIANTLGLLLIQLGKPAEALEPLEDAKTALPHIAFVRNNLGVAYERTGRLDDAKLEYLAAVEAGDAGGKAMKSLVRLGATDTTSPSGDIVTAAATEPSE